MMLFSLRRSATALLLTGALALGACSHRPPAALPTPAKAPAPIDHGAEIDAIVALLDQGDEAAARPRIAALLTRDPADSEARVLDDSLTQDPVALLGPKSFGYKVKPGDTMVGLAEKFLGNRLKAYQLARYNDVKVPAALAAGTMLKIPGTPPKPAPLAHDKPSRGAKGGSSAAAPAATAAPVAPKVDPVAARQARAAGLSALNQGQVGRAVLLLRRAAALNPADPLVQRDLARAERIAATVKSKR